MAVTRDMLRTWRSPGGVIREQLAQGPREDRAFAILMAACFLIFIAQWPRLSRQAAGFDSPAGTKELSLMQLFTYEFVAWLIVWPLLLYGLSAFSHLIAKALRGKGSFYSARFALFWSLLATTPVALLYGMVAGFIGPSFEKSIVGLMWFAAFGVIWMACLYEAERSAPHA